MNSSRTIIRLIFMMCLFMFSLRGINPQMPLRAKCLKSTFRRLIYLVFPEIALPLTQEDGTKVILPSFSCSVVVFLWKLIKQKLIRLYLRIYKTLFERQLELDAMLAEGFEENKSDQIEYFALSITLVCEVAFRFW